MQYGPLSGPIEPENARNIDDERCEAQVRWLLGERTCGEWAYATCFDCDDAICEHHATLIPGFSTLYLCPFCLKLRTEGNTNAHAA